MNWSLPSVRMLAIVFLGASGAFAVASMGGCQTDIQVDGGTIHHGSGECMCPDAVLTSTQAQCTSDLEGCTCGLEAPCPPDTIGQVPSTYECISGDWKLLKYGTDMRDCKGNPGMTSSSSGTPSCAASTVQITFDDTMPSEMNCPGPTDLAVGDYTEASAADGDALRAVFKKLHDGVPVFATVTFNHPAVNAVATRVIASPGSVEVAIRDGRSCDGTLSDNGWVGTNLASQDFLANCATATDVATEIDCVQHAFTTNGLMPICD